MNDLRTPAILLASVVICYVVSSILSALSLDVASDVVQMLTYCSLALLVSWLLLHYGSGSSDVIYAIDAIANFLFALVSICHSYNINLTLMSAVVCEIVLFWTRKAGPKSYSSCSSSFCCYQFSKSP